MLSFARLARLRPVHGQCAAAAERHAEPEHQHRSAPAEAHVDDHGQHQPSRADHHNIQHALAPPTRGDFSASPAQPQAARAGSTTPLADRPALPQFTAAQRAALAKLLLAPSLLGRRNEWRHNWADPAERPVTDRTMRVLARRKLVLLSRRQDFGVARLTRLGVIYAHDLAREVRP